MPLLIVPLAENESGLLTIAEWDALTGRALVVFEDAGHPLMQRLAEAGIAVEALGREPDPLDDSVALVASPDSNRIGRLAEAGAAVTSPGAPPPDDMTAARGAYIGRRAGASLGRLAQIMARLRGPGGCPWDAEQTHSSLRVHLQEETYEVLEAIDDGNLTEELEEELGDLLLQVAFHSQMAADDGRFDLAGVADSIAEKLIRRHPHVFGETEVSGAGEVVKNWEAIKSTEKERTGAFEGIPKGLPALLRTYKMQKRATALGFEATHDEALDKARAALDGTSGPDGLGEALFWLVAVARAGGVDPESALRSATERVLAPLERSD